MSALADVVTHCFIAEQNSYFKNDKDESKLDEELQRAISALQLSPDQQREVRVAF